MKVKPEHADETIFIRTLSASSASILYWVVLDGGKVLYINVGGKVMPSGYSEKSLRLRVHQGDLLEVLPPHEVLA